MLGVASGPGVGLAGRGGALTSDDLFCWPFWDGGPGVGCILCCFEVCSAGRFVLGLACLFCSCGFRSFWHCGCLAWGRES